MNNIIFWNGTPELCHIKRQYFYNIDCWNPPLQHADDCKAIARLIQADAARCRQDLCYNLIKNTCIISCCLKDDYPTIIGIMQITISKDSIYIDNISAFYGAGKCLLQFIIYEALFTYQYKYVYITAAGDGGTNDKQSKLINYYEGIVRGIPDVKIETLGFSVYYYLAINEEYLPRPAGK